jgi:hypothetical protein
MRRSLAALMLIGGLLAASCSGAAAPTPQIIYVTPPPTVAPTRSPTPRPSSAPSASVSPCAEPPAPSSYYCAAKNGEGGHGGPPLLDLPGSVAFDYRVSGTCVFSLGLATETSVVGFPSLTMTVSGPEITGTWRVSIKPGSYYPVIGEAVGCLYSVNVRNDR